MKKNLLPSFILLSLTSIFCLTCFISCATTDKPASPAAEPVSSNNETDPKAFMESTCMPENKKWMNTNVAGNLAEQKPSPKDDFYQSVNYEWLKARTSIPEDKTKLSWMSELSPAVNEQIKLMLADQNCLSHEEHFLKTFWNQLTDKETRTRNGTEYARIMIDRYTSLKTIEELWQTCYAEDMPDCIPLTCSWYFPNILNSNLFSPLVTPLFIFGSYNIYSNPEAPESISYVQTVKDFFQTVLLKCGLTEQEAQAFIEEAYEFEKKIAAGSNIVNPSPYNMDRYSKETLKTYYPNLPLFDVIEHKGGKFQTITVSDIKAFQTLNSLFTQENLEQLKKLTILNFLNNYTFILDMECQELSLKTTQKLQNITVETAEEDFFLQCLWNIEEPLCKAWLERYFTQQTKDEVTELTQKIIKIYENRLNEADWMSERTKLQAFEKLNSLSFYIGYARMNDYSDLEFYDSSEKFALIENLIKYRKKKEALDLSYTSGINYKDVWNAINALSVDAFYSSTNNSINICAGILNGTFYSSEWPVEKKLAGIGFVIGHEITHCFDITGSTFDKDGNYIFWWDVPDYNTLVSKTELTGNYALNLDVVQPQDKLPAYWGEVTADTGAMSVMLDIAKEIPGFDYNEFFTDFARFWCTVYRLDAMTSYILTNEHPAPYVRVNNTVQLFEEFYKTYGINETDGMYRKPEERYKVW